MSIGPGYGSPQDKIEAASMTAEHWMLKAHEWQERANAPSVSAMRCGSCCVYLTTNCEALYDDPVERKGIATVIDAALLAGKEVK